MKGMGTNDELLRRVIVSRYDQCIILIFKPMTMESLFQYRAEIDLRDIGITFGNRLSVYIVREFGICRSILFNLSLFRYGDGKTLAKWIKDDLSGDYEKLCLAVCGLD